MTAIALDSIHAGCRDRSDFGDIAGLAASIQSVGLLHPVVVTADHELVAGDRRLAAVRSLGWTEVPVTVVDLATAADVLRAEADENTCRKSLTPSEAERARERRAKVLAPVAKANTVANLPNQGGNFPPSAPVGKVRDVAATGTGFSGRTLDKVREVRVVAEAPETPEPIRKVAVEAIGEMDRTGRVDGAFKRVRQAVVAEQTKPVTDYLATDRRLQDVEYVRQFIKALGPHTAATAFDPIRLADLLDDTEVLLVTTAARGLTEFADKITRQRSGLRVIAGGRA